MNFEYPDYFKQKISEIKSAAVMDTGKNIIGWTYIVLGTHGSSLGTGTAPTDTIALRIAIAESLEKLEFDFGLDETTKESIKMGQFPTRCGLAAGFEMDATRFRSIAEALERWVWSKWIDEGYEIPQISKPFLSPLPSFFASSFDRLIFFEKPFSGFELGIPSHLRFGAVIGIKGKGAYPGSRVCTPNEDPWSHALIEAWRHVKISENLEKRHDIYPILRDRLSYFSKNSEHALQQTSQATTPIWPTPKLDFCTLIRQLPSHPYFLYRTLCRDYTPWHLESHDRFVY